MENPRASPVTNLTCNLILTRHVFATSKHCHPSADQSASGSPGDTFPHQQHPTLCSPRSNHKPTPTTTRQQQQQQHRPTPTMRPTTQASNTHSAPKHEAPTTTTQPSNSLGNKTHSLVTNNLHTKARHWDTPKAHTPHLRQPK